MYTSPWYGELVDMTACVFETESTKTLKSSPFVVATTTGVDEYVSENVYVLLVSLENVRVDISILNEATVFPKMKDLCKLRENEPCL
tara:strand:- start:2 stop:262 length:261 start_codon:yes stop_codon:yes gene_type:complete